MGSATVTLTVAVTALPSTNAAYKNTVITLADAAGVSQTATVDGTTEATPWTATFANVAAGSGTASAQAFDTAGVAIGAPISTSFTEAGSPTFPAPTAIAVTVS